MFRVSNTMKSNELKELPLITICSNNQVLKEQGGKILPLQYRFELCSFTYYRFAF